MRKIITTIMYIFVGITSMCAQQYNYTFIQKAGHEGYLYDEPNATIILDESVQSADVLSTWQSLPSANNIY